jgi:hypothetical protein
LYCRPVSRVWENLGNQSHAIHSHKSSVNHSRSAVIGAGHPGIQTRVSPSRNAKVTGSTLWRGSPTSHNRRIMPLETAQVRRDVVRHLSATTL